MATDQAAGPANGMAVDAEEATDEGLLLAQVRSEARAQLGAIIGYCELLTEDGVSVESSSFLGDLGKIQTAAKRLNGVLRETLLPAQSDPAKVEFVPGKYAEDLSHKLLTPVNHIIGYSEMLQETAEDWQRPDLAADFHRLDGIAKSLLTNVEVLLHPQDGEGIRATAGIEEVSDDDLALEVSGVGRAAVGAPVKSHRVLIVDDEELNRNLLGRAVESLGHTVEIACDGFEALTMVKLDVDLVLLDALMPGMDGFEVLRKIREDPEIGDLPVIMVTALNKKAEQLRAIEAGASDFIRKPVTRAELRVRLGRELEKKHALDSLKQHESELESVVEHRTEALRHALREAAEAQRTTFEAHLDTIHRLVAAAEYRDETTGQHIDRMSRFCALIAESVGLSPGEVETVLHASPMHDVGKLGVPDSILLKPGKLTDDEREIMNKHTSIGARILGSSASPLLQVAKVIAFAHHEKWDGTGYPQKLSGEDIPLYGRICAVADVFDALTTERPYKSAFPNEKAAEILREESGRHFDARMVQVFLSRTDEIAAIQKKYVEEQEAGGHSDVIEMR